MFPTKEAIHGIKRQAVLREAAASFNLRGYHGTSMNEIAASLGVTKAALYHYFPNKNMLLAGCFEHAMEAAFASLERGRREGRNGRERLVLTITGYITELLSELNCCVVLMEEHALEPNDRAKLVEERDRFERALRGLVREGIADGSIAPCDPKLAIFVILGAMNWVPKWFKPTGAWKPEQLTVALGQIFERALSSTPASAMARDVGDLPLDARIDDRKERRGALMRASSASASVEPSVARGKGLRRHADGKKAAKR